MKCIRFIGCFLLIICLLAASVPTGTALSRRDTARQSVRLEPADSDAPFDPEEPADPDDPVDQDTPLDPEEPGDPADPDGPADPTGPDDPIDTDPMAVFALPDDRISCSFEDVDAQDWFYPYVAYGQSLGIINGKTPTAFRPQDAMSAAEAVTLAVRIRELYHGVTPDNSHDPGTPWYTPYVTRAAEYGMLPADLTNYNAPIRRDQAAAIFAVTLPQQELAEINRVNRLPDVDASNPYYTEILTLYRAGILTGSDSLGSFHPGNGATRAELVKILCALINPVLRKQFHLLLGDLSVFAAGVTEDPVCTFSDVGSNQWFYEDVAVQQQLGIMNGVSETSFAPGGTVSYAQVLKVAVEIYEKYYDFPQTAHGSPWYAYYVEKAQEYGILTQPLADYQAPACRGDVILLLGRTLPEKELSQLNEISSIPDVPSSSPYYATAMQFYRAGILRGSDDMGTAHLQNNIQRSELAALLTRLVLPDHRLHFTLKVHVLDERIDYGVSGSGKYPLSAYRFGTGKNVMVLCFAIHGWEDNWNRDGAELVYLADEVRAYLKQHESLLDSGDWTVYVLRCINPDGLYLGTTCNGPGRCTTTSFNASGQLVQKGMDMNRCFPYRFTARTDARNYNGTAPLQCVEARALASFLQNVRGDGKNILIDTHGWFSQIITSAGYGAIYQAFARQFPGNSYASLINGSGYMSSWAAYSLGYDSCLLELPSWINSHSAFLSSGCIGKFETAITELLQSYRSPVRSVADAGLLPGDN